MSAMRRRRTCSGTSCFGVGMVVVKLEGKFVIVFFCTRRVLGISHSFSIQIINMSA